MRIGEGREWSGSSGVEKGSNGNNGEEMRQMLRYEEGMTGNGNGEWRRVEGWRILTEYRFYGSDQVHGRVRRSWSEHSQPCPHPSVVSLGVPRVYLP